MHGHEPALLNHLHMTPAENLEQNVSNEFDLIISESATVIPPLHCSYNHVHKSVKGAVVVAFLKLLTPHLGIGVELLMPP